MKTNQKILRMVELAVLTALIVVLQQFSIPLGENSLCLVLIPIVVGAVLLGPSAGAFLGGVFGVVITVLAFQARLGVLTTKMLESNAFITIAICMLKGIAAGWVAGLIAKAFKKREFIGIVLAAAAAPVVNTGIYLLGITTVFRDITLQWAATDPQVNYTGGSIVFLAFVILVGVNFIIELTANLVLSPSIAAIVRAVRKTTR